MTPLQAGEGEGRDLDGPLVADPNTCATLDPETVVGTLELLEDSLVRIDERVEKTNGSIVAHA
jgi:hypothetical protein